MDKNHTLARVARLSDHDLLAQLKDLAQREREATVALIVHLAELDERRLYLAEGYSSLFKYCTDVLHLSEHAAYNRIEAARAARRFPVLLDHLAAGWVTLFAVRRLAPHLTPKNHHDVLALARYKTKQEIEELIARLRPQPPVPDQIRKLPTPTLAASTTPDPTPLLDEAQQVPCLSRDDDTSENTPAFLSTMAAPATLPESLARRAVVSPLAPERYKVTFTADAEVHAKLREAQTLLRHQIPDGDLAKIFDRALGALLSQLRKQKLAATDRPRENWNCASGAPPNSLPRSRNIPAAVRRAVWARDEGQCAFVSSDGRRCAEAAFVEFHHVVPYARVGASSVNNIELRCRAHNGYEAECHFGRWDGATVREDLADYAASALAVGAAFKWSDQQLVLERVPRLLRPQRQTRPLPSSGARKTTTFLERGRVTGPARPVRACQETLVRPPGSLRSYRPG